jgi:hypothetical protein
MSETKSQYYEMNPHFKKLPFMLTNDVRGEEKLAEMSEPINPVFTDAEEGRGVVAFVTNTINNAEEDIRKKTDEIIACLCASSVRKSDLLVQHQPSIKQIDRFRKEMAKLQHIQGHINHCLQCNAHIAADERVSFEVYIRTFEEYVNHLNSIILSTMMTENNDLKNYMYTIYHSNTSTVIGILDSPIDKKIHEVFNYILKLELLE